LILFRKLNKSQAVYFVSLIKHLLLIRIEINS
jgi:hypothetical protein